MDDIELYIKSGVIAKVANMNLLNENWVYMLQWWSTYENIEGDYKLNWPIYYYGDQWILDEDPNVDVMSHATCHIVEKNKC